MDKRIFITGDKHGAITPFFGLKEKQDLRDSDIMLITGDAGYVFYDDYKYTIGTLEQLFPGKIAFIDGNHENFDILGTMDEEVWCGGKVHRVSDVAGKANVIIWPDLNVGNVGVKLVQMFGHADAYGPMLQGFKKIVCDCSRSAPVSEIVGNVVMSCVRSQCIKGE